MYVWQFFSQSEDQIVEFNFQRSSQRLVATVVHQQRYDGQEWGGDKEDEVDIDVVGVLIDVLRLDAVDEDHVYNADYTFTKLARS